MPSRQSTKQKIGLITNVAIKPLSRLNLILFVVFIIILFANQLIKKEFVVYTTTRNSALYRDLLATLRT